VVGSSFTNGKHGRLSRDMMYTILCLLPGRFHVKGRPIHFSFHGGNPKRWGRGAYLVRFHLVGDWGFGQAGRSTIGICFLPISLRQIIKGQGHYK